MCQFILSHVRNNGVFNNTSYLILRHVYIDPISTLSKNQTVILIPKGDGKYFRGIGLVQVLWKDTTGIINRRLNASI